MERVCGFNYRMILEDPGLVNLLSFTWEIIYVYPWLRSIPPINIKGSAIEYGLLEARMISCRVHEHIANFNSEQPIASGQVISKTASVFKLSGT